MYKPYDDRDAVATLLTAVAQVFEDFRYVERFDRGEAATLVFKARVGDRELDGVDILSFDQDGLVRELTVMVRPLSGATALAEAMQARLAAAEQQVA